MLILLPTFETFYVRCEFCLHTTQTQWEVTTCTRHWGRKPLGQNHGLPFGQSHSKRVTHVTSENQTNPESKQTHVCWCDRRTAIRMWGNSLAKTNPPTEKTQESQIQNQPKQYSETLWGNQDRGDRDRDRDMKRCLLPKGLCQFWAFKSLKIKKEPWMKETPAEVLTGRDLRARAPQDSGEQDRVENWITNFASCPLRQSPIPKWSPEGEAEGRQQGPGMHRLDPPRLGPVHERPDNNLSRPSRKHYAPAQFTSPQEIPTKYPHEAFTKADSMPGERARFKNYQRTKTIQGIFCV